MLTSIYTEIANKKGTKIAVAFGDKEFSYDEFHIEIDKFATFLKSKDIKPSQRVAVSSFSPVELLFSYYAGAKCGVSIVPIPFIDPQRQKGALETSNAALFIESYPQLEPINIDVSFDKEAMVIFTSGTTSSKLKGVRLSNCGINNICAFMNSKMEVDEGIAELVFASIDHAFGFGRCHSVLMAGGKVVLPTQLSNPLSIASLFSKYDCNALSTAPSLLAALLQVGKSELAAVAENLKWLQTGAMRFDHFFRIELYNSLPKTRVFLHYGLSEAMRVTFFELNRNLDKVRTEGPASECSELKIIDEQGSTLPPFESGRIAIRGGNLCLGYLDDELWRSQLQDGWFITSDVGYLDEQGYLVFSGRSDDVINYNGVLVHPDEIESKLVTLFKGNAFTVLGMEDPSKVKDSIIVLCVEGATKLTLKDVAKHLKDTDSNFRPNKLVTLSELPRTRSGKVSRASIKKYLCEQYEK